MLRNLASSTLLAAALAAPFAHAQEPAPAPPVAEVAIADGAQLTAHWNASIYGLIWNDPACAAIRAKTEAEIAKAAADIGFDPLAVLAAFKDARFRFHGMDLAAKKPLLDAQVVLPGLAQAVFAALAKDLHGEPGQVAGADESLTASEGGALARHGDALVFAMGAAAKPFAAAPTSFDVSARVDIAGFITALRAAMPEDKRAEFDAQLTEVARYKNMTYQGELVPGGIHEIWTVTGAVSKAYAKADATLLERLPATTMMAMAIGIDGKAWLDEAGGQIWDNPAYAEGLLKADETLMGLGVKTPLKEIVAQATGTVLIALGQGAPAPAMTIAIPRSPGIDELVLAGLAAGGMAAPDEGGSVALPIPNVPIAVQLLRTAGHWVATSDPVLPSTWATAAPGGFGDTAAYKLAVEKAGPGAWMVGASDTPQVVRAVTGYLQMAMGFIGGGMTPEEQQALFQGLATLAAKSGTGYLVGRSDGETMITEAQGLVTFGGIVPIAGMIAGFSHLNRAADAADIAMQPDVAAIGQAPPDTVAAAIATVADAQAQFQASSLVDADGDGIGEYGLLAELAGRRATSLAAGEVRLLGGALAESDSVDGYRFKILLPAADGAITDDTEVAKRAAVPAAADRQEAHWALLVWKSDNTGPVWLQTEDGVLRIAPAIAEQMANGDAAWTPSWDAALTAEWTAQPGWEPTK